MAGRLPGGKEKNTFVGLQDEQARLGISTLHTNPTPTHFFFFFFFFVGTD
jgi:hypothetical protein